ncbi:MAG: acetyl-CoA carboxylase biotin carboxylase subunit [Spartobacteria bacterium AMD-G5]|nr:MAG: acetyl-CoA carboxylase biotin carboxylase subunit [Spartobacteria bacterium AMD-G5]
MFKKILIANRGEIALRIIRACKELGVQSVAIYSEPDIHSLHVQLADEAICIGPAPSNESYLKIDRIISAAEIADVDAIHPGYGFLAENAHFAEVCASCNIKFIGPTPNAIRLMGDKNSARDSARKAGVPISPGSDGTVDTEDEALKIARKIGFPVMIKAVAGGGGRGMRIAHNDSSLVQGYHAARMEADKAFGNGAVYIEKFIVNPHHIEFQVFGDDHGRVVHLGERDCSLQRRNQKIVEECPSPLMSEELRKRMGDASIKLCESVGYTNAGTIEYLVDDAGNFYFMEMNTRIQVEHPITEEVYGCDLVKQQIQVAAGEHLGKHVLEARPRGHAMECRINAEDPEKNFMPCPGNIELYYAPGGRGVRIDSHAYAGYPIPPNYDSMIAKVIATASSRSACISRMSRALSEYMITGIKTTIPFQQAIMQNSSFREGKYHTGFVEQLLRDGVPIIR